MFDYYAMPSNTPGIDNKNPDILKRIESVEAAINDDIGMRNCSFNFMLHEFEGILFSVNQDSLSDCQAPVEGPQPFFQARIWN